ncbi:hypothetical protein BDW02DRAFT_121551 [Decorospora gaudefroyi]|uniref:Uncharacterized protein n=1 Tax=Decorospora gaudefroyi TaxID=184978 RepID=A0A6A5KNT4_9PLEO|nr:hypothetical protein BDW02DRAFT_121551 [Decorospora gaudefroyi]
MICLTPQRRSAAASLTNRVRESHFPQCEHDNNAPQQELSILPSRVMAFAFAFHHKKLGHLHPTNCTLRPSCPVWAWFRQIRNRDSRRSALCRLMTPVSTHLISLSAGGCAHRNFEKALQNKFGTSLFLYRLVGLYCAVEVNNVRQYAVSRFREVVRESSLSILIVG